MNRTEPARFVEIFWYEDENFELHRSDKVEEIVKAKLDSIGFEHTAKNIENWTRLLGYKKVN